MLDKIKSHYGSKLKIALMMGGLRPGTTELMSAASREEILHHWREVQKMTGQEFTFEDAMPDGFIYDTEPPSRAVITVSEISPESTLPFFKKVQHAFYVEQKNVSDAAVLSKLTSSFPVDNLEFAEKFDSDELKRKTQLHFQQTRQAEVRGFPTLVLNRGKEFKKISSGYSSFKDLKQEIDAWLECYI